MLEEEEIVCWKGRRSCVGRGGGRVLGEEEVEVLREEVEVLRG